MIGKTAKKLREACGETQVSGKMTQKTWSEILGQSEWTVKAWEQGKLQIKPHSENLLVLTAESIIGKKQVSEILSAKED